MIEGKRLFNLEDEKPPYSEWFVNLDIGCFLGGETIQTCTFSAIDEDTTEDVSEVVLDQAKCTWLTRDIRPWIRAGVNGHTYLVEVRVITLEGSKECFYIRFDVAGCGISRKKSIGLDAVIIVTP